MSRPCASCPKILAVTRSSGHQRGRRITMSATEADDIKKVIAETFVAIGTVARALHVQDARLQPTLDAITAHAAAAHPTAKDAGLILLIGGKLIPQATTGRAPQLLDTKQQETGQGPCIEAAR